MFARSAVLAVTALLVLGPAAWAADKPAYGPPAPWVRPAPVPAAPDDPQAPAVQALLDDNQSLLAADGGTFYNRRIFKILKTEGLANAGVRSVTWDPARDKITLHALTILRDGVAIDLLKGGKDVLVLRREKNLERAMLDGRLTASIQMQDLRVGDVVDWAYTTEHRDPVVGGRIQDFERLGWSGAIGRYRVRVLWPPALPVAWKATAGFPEPAVSVEDGRKQLLVDVANATAPKAPTGAPSRFQRVGQLQTTTYQGWGEISRQMAPLYAKASTLTATSPLKAEAAAIAAASADPKVRAFAALQLVEDKTRYLFLGMNDGGYVPAAADETWARRFGDCKGKTVLLLALLRELGIEAEPVLVNAGGGDGLDERVPAIGQFNHVLVKARLDGRAYWLDGTRSGDKGGLDALRPPPFRWGLPVRAAGADLEAIDQPPYDRPQSQTVTRFDASGGLDVPAPVRIETLSRGDAARSLSRGFASTPRADIERNIKQSLSRSLGWVTIKTIDWSEDAATGEVTMVMTGEADIDWRNNPDLGVREFRLPGSSAAAAFARREPGPADDAPFAIAYPMFTRSETQIVLPAGGAGFTVRGQNLDAVIAGAEVKRTAGVTDGVARFSYSNRTMVREIPFAEAQEANKTLRKLAAEEQFVRAPKGR